MRNILDLAVAAILTTIFCSAFYHSNSFDMGFHYAVVFHYFDRGYCAPLGIMCHYPSAPHATAAIIGVLVRSPFLGMIMLTTFSAFTIYASLFFLTWPNALAIGGICVACLVNYVFGLPLIGHEIIGNFFFGQLVGTAALFVYVATFPKMSTTATGIISVVAVFLFMWVYPLCAVQLAGAVTILLVLSHAPIPGIAIFIVASGLAIYFHPLFSLTLDIAQNNGAISTGGNIPPNWTVGLAVALAVLALYLTVSRRAPHKFIALAAGVAGAAIAQWLALVVLHQGAPYAITKHMFGVFTLLVTAIGMAMPSQSSVSIMPTYKPLHASPFLPVMAAAFCVFLLISPLRTKQPTLLMVRAEQDSSIVPASPQSRFALDVGPHNEDMAVAGKRYGLVPP